MFVLEGSLHRTVQLDVRYHHLQSHELLNYLLIKDVQIFWKLLRNLSFSINISFAERKVDMHFAYIKDSRMAV